MAISVLLRINGTDWTGSVLTPFEIEKNKLWGDDTGRVMSGKMFGTLVGIFPKLNVKFHFDDEVKQSQLLTVLDSSWQSVEVYDPKTRALKTIGTYSNDYKITVFNLQPHYGEIAVSFIAREKE